MISGPGSSCSNTSPSRSSSPSRRTSRKPLAPTVSMGMVCTLLTSGYALFSSVSQFKFSRLTYLCKVDSHPHNLRHVRLPPAIAVLPPPPDRAQGTPRQAQALRDQRHRLPQHAANLPLRHPLLDRRRRAERHALLQRFLLRHPLDPHLRRNGALLNVQLLRLQRQALHSVVVVIWLRDRIASLQRRGALPWRIPGHRRSAGGGQSDGDCERTGARGSVPGVEPAATGL